MITYFKKLIALDNPFRLFYHLIKAVIANFIYGFPSRKMIIIGVTGTNGKTTTTNIIARGLKASGKKVFMFSTVNYFIGDEEFRNDTKMTSPNPFVLQKLLYDAKKSGCEIAVIETSSHALFMNRVWGIEYDIAVLTNISQDHLDLHKTMDNYVKTKLKLFKNLISNARKPKIKKTAIINIDSKYKELFLSETYDNLTTYGFDINTNLRPYDLQNSIDYTSFKVKIPDDVINIKTTLRGKFNTYNILGAIGVFLSLGIKPRIIEKSISDISFIPGRLEEISNNEGYKIFVDYAHTPDAIENVIRTVIEIEGIGKIITVFGATGDRDTSKRPIMGQLVSELSDVVILTEDDNYSESVENIIKDILPGIERKEGDNFWIITDREDAIRTALIKAEKKDAVLILGKGDEHMIVRNEGVLEYNDKKVILDILKDIDDNKIV